MAIKLIVIRTPDIKLLSDFYSVFGIAFEYHKHGNSPYHYSATLEQTVLEIYPLAKDQSAPDKNLRLGFSISNFEQVMQALKESGATILADPLQTDFGYMCLIEDPDGRKIELYKK